MEALLNLRGLGFKASPFLLETTLPLMNRPLGREQEEEGGGGPVIAAVGVGVGVGAEEVAPSPDASWDESFATPYRTI